MNKTVNITWERNTCYKKASSKDLYVPSYLSICAEKIYIRIKNAIQWLGLIAVLILLQFTHIILAITLNLGRTLTRKIVLCYILNLHLVEKTSRAANLFNVSDTETYWINLAVIGSLIAKVFLKHNIIFLFTYSLYSSFYIARQSAF